MPETLSQERVRVHVSRSLTSEPPVDVQPTGSASPSLFERITKVLKNPLVLVGITWVVMAFLLAREILAR